MMTERFLFACAALSLVACTGTRINGKVASCADQAPIDGARISVTENSAVDGTSALPTKNDAGPGAAPSTSDKDGSFKIDVVSGDAASYRVKMPW